MADVVNQPSDARDRKDTPVELPLVQPPNSTQSIDLDNNNKDYSH